MAKRKTKNGEPVAGRTEVLQFLTGLLRGEVHETSVAKDGSLVENEPGLRERLRAAELLGKGCGAFSADEREGAAEEDWKIEIEVLDDANVEEVKLYGEEMAGSSE